MQEKHFALLDALCRHELQNPLQSCQPESIDADTALEYIWPLQDRFRKRLHQLKTVRYRPQYEREADKAIRDYVLNDASWDDIPLVVLRVLLERYQQSIILCVANTLDKSRPLMHIPANLSPHAKTKFAVAFWLYLMKLPYEVTDESALDIDSAFAGLSDRLH
ncbi:TPA: hypothetical protein ACYFH0_001898 [Klebsiella pneumoniae]|uniref:hypothetical protein n=1 Tax=Klebsiella pneumoniae complex TaxID=3390273 RepID=UPI001330BD13|nr:MULTISPECIES: hypothetical protein [Klebsiella]EKT9724318.1 hypothetical protein [Klebsiella pneumoniae]EKW6095095.1 hypothetical protein [Klebsiella pneumoniae]BBR06991.1 hypothetical protein WP3S18C02_42610 [Klebsiella quasipneumoniae]